MDLLMLKSLSQTRIVTFGKLKSAMTLWSASEVSLKDVI